MRALLCSRLPAETCVFADVLEVWGRPDAVSDHFDSMQGYEAKLQTAKSLPRWTHGWCLSHNDWCPLQQSRLRVQGPPCVDWSQAGSGKGIDGPFFKTLLAAGAKADLTSPSLNVVENVTGLPFSVLQDCYGPRFSWQAATVCPSDVGFAGIARTRTVVCRISERQADSCRFLLIHCCAHAKELLCSRLLGSGYVAGRLEMLAR